MKNISDFLDLCWSLHHEPVRRAETQKVLARHMAQFQQQIAGHPHQHLLTGLVHLVAHVTLYHPQRPCKQIIQAVALTAMEARDLLGEHG